MACASPHVHMPLTCVTLNIFYVYVWLLQAHKLFLQVLNSLSPFPFLHKPLVRRLPCKGCFRRRGYQCGPGFITTKQRVAFFVHAGSDRQEYEMFGSVDIAFVGPVKVPHYARCKYNLPALSTGIAIVYCNRLLKVEGCNKFF